MPFIYGVLSEECNRLQEKKNDYEEKLKNLPKGSLVKKQIKGRHYDYLVYRSEGKVITEYVPKERLEELRSQLERRKKIKESLKSINHDMKLIRKVVKT